MRPTLPDPVRARDVDPSRRGVAYEFLRKTLEPAGTSSSLNCVSIPAARERYTATRRSI